MGFLKVPLKKKIQILATSGANSELKYKLKEFLFTLISLEKK